MGWGKVIIDMLLGKSFEATWGGRSDPECEFAKPFFMVRYASIPNEHLVSFLSHGRANMVASQDTLYA
jgi:hypothetical protein